jgi:hypothetical protein
MSQPSLFSRCFFSQCFGALLLTSGLLLAAPAFAQEEGPSSTGPVPSAPVPTSVPVDGGASLLLASGVAYGLRRLRRCAVKGGRKLS